MTKKYSVTPIARPTNARQLAAELSFTVEPMYHVDETLIGNLSKAIQEEIDSEILINQYKDAGWIDVRISRFTDNNHAIDIVEWLKHNITGKYHHQGARFLFEYESDANWFKLRWF